LTPTVALCLQQCRALQEEIRSVQIRSFSSMDNVDKWHSSQVWDDVLTNVRIAVATYEVLRDALSKAFVKMESIALIVFDEGQLGNISFRLSVFVN
jgi:ERCC4-related helicase